MILSNMEAVVALVSFLLLGGGGCIFLAYLADFDVPPSWGAGALWMMCLGVIGLVGIPICHNVDTTEEENRILAAGELYVEIHGIAPVGKHLAEEPVFPTPALVPQQSPAVTPIVLPVPVNITLKQWYAGMAISSLGAPSDPEQAAKRAWAVAEHMMAQETP